VAGIGEIMGKAAERGPARLSIELGFLATPRCRLNVTVLYLYDMFCL